MLAVMAVCGEDTINVCAQNIRMRARMFLGPSFSVSRGTWFILIVDQTNVQV